MKSLIVHIGPYKTGSTAIQKVLAASRRSLESAAILYPTSRKTKPLEAHRNRVVLISGLDMPEAMATTEEPGGDHARGAAGAAGRNHQPTRNAGFRSG